jgi:hypothetical protein
MARPAGALQKLLSPSDARMVRSVLRYDVPLRAATLLFASASMVGVVLLVTGKGSPRLLVGIPLCVAAAISALTGRVALRRRARQEILAWLPATRITHTQTHMGSARPWGGDWEGLWSSEGPPAEDLSAGLQVARTEIRDATRALLASLTDELVRGPRRGVRPACRHARLRDLGRAKPLLMPAPSTGLTVAKRSRFRASGRQVHPARRSLAS